MSATYIELHASSAFSFLEGASLPEELIAACAEYSMPAIALLDRDGVYGAPRFHLAAKKAGIQAHIGAEVTSTTGVRYPLLAETREGYQNLCRLLTRMKLRAPKGKGAVMEDELAEYSHGLICLTGGEHGPLTMAIPNRNGRETLDRLIRICGRENIYVELQRHYNREQEAISRRSLLPNRFSFHWWQPTAFATLCRKNARFSMCSPRSGITALWKPPAACLQKISIVI